MALLAQTPMEALWRAPHCLLQKTCGALLIRDGYLVTAFPHHSQLTVIFPAMSGISTPRKQKRNSHRKKGKKVSLKPLKPSKQARNNRKQELRKALEQQRSQPQPTSRPAAPVFKPLG